MKVKICGFTNLEDALAAAECGTDMMGFNFYPPSPRSISIESCAGIVDELHRRYPLVATVGVFVNASTEVIQRTLAACGLQFAQLHGDETPADVQTLAAHAYKAIRPKSEREANEQLQQYAGVGVPFPALLLDAYKLGAYGGTGEVANWEIAARLSRSAPLLLAGGLTPDNVLAAVEQVRPWGVDVASGVESAPGKKDVIKIKAFVQAIRE